MICTLLNIRLLTLYWVTQVQRLVMSQFMRTYVDTRGSGLHCLWRLRGALCLPSADSGGWCVSCLWEHHATVWHDVTALLHFCTSLSLSLKRMLSLDTGANYPIWSHHLDPESSHICKDRVQNEVPLWTWCHIVKREEDFGWALLTVSQNYTASLFLFETESRVSCTRDNIQIECVARDDFELWLLLSAPPCPVYCDVGGRIQCFVHPNQYSHSVNRTPSYTYFIVSASQEQVN